ncbi:conserved protein of unknown function [Candidatus Nitrotoga arctica]|uniref:Beta-barrel assembly machine subunit BamC n=1 Tax=Candidatus Nitrotoga arctica TaxID=453162 RepID=A0ABM8YW12_9PROT|nr:conserved protein of unknown function [Candidatus Nitrotoga arctica]
MNILMKKINKSYGCKRFLSCLAIGIVCLSTAGCVTGPRSLETDRLTYNEAIKSTTEAQLLLNIVRLRYNDTPSSLAVSAIATQFEIQKSFSLTPFFGVNGGDPAQHFSALLPQAQISTTDRPTITLTPLDDQEFTRKLFTPMTLDGVLYLTKTTWPISTVFRLWLENLNWVSNAQNGSGPTLKSVPDYAEFLRGIDALQALQDRGHIVFGTEEREEAQQGTVAAGLTAHDLLDAAKEGYEFRPDHNSALVLVKKSRQPVMKVHPEALASAEMRELAQVFGLRPGLPKYDLKIENLDPFKINHPPDGVDVMDLETRSLLQVLYFVSKGLDVPVEHVGRGFVQATTDETGQPFDWRKITSNLFHVYSVIGDRPPTAHVAVKYLDYWFYIDKADQDTMATFSLLMQLARLETNGKTGLGPALTLPLGGR